MSPSHTTHLTSEEKEGGRQALLDFMKSHPRAQAPGPARKNRES